MKHMRNQSFFNLNERSDILLYTSAGTRFRGWGKLLKKRDEEHFEPMVEAPICEVPMAKGQ